MPAIDLKQYTAKKRPKKIKSAPTIGAMDLLTKDISFGSGELEDKKKEHFYLELNSLLFAGINLKSSLEMIVQDQMSDKDKTLFSNILNAVIKGEQLSSVLKDTKKFSLYEVFTLQIGEETGKLVEVLTDLARYYGNKIKQRRKIISALTYPCIVITTSLGAVFFMLKFIVPMFGDIFKRFGGHLPWITEKIVGISRALEDYFYPGLIFIGLLSAALLVLRKTARFKQLTSSLLLRLPIVGNLIQKIYLARFSNSMRLLINARLPLLKSISLIRQMIKFYPLESVLLTVENDILRGKPLHQSMQQFKIFPAKMVQFIKVGEETNQLDYFFERISQQYVEEIEYKTAALSSIMEPLIIIFLGLVVGIILISMYLPLFEMSNSFQ